MFDTYQDLINSVKLKSRKAEPEKYIEHEIVQDLLTVRKRSKITLLTEDELAEAQALIAKETAEKAVAQNIPEVILEDTSEPNILVQEIDPPEVTTQEITSETLPIFDVTNGPFTGNIDMDVLQQAIQSQAMHVQEDETKIWVQFERKRPMYILIGSKDKYVSRGYKVIESCPICGQSNTEESFACCDEHMRQYLSDLKLKK